MVASSAGTPHVAIVGGGIGGVAAAAFLQRAGMPAIEHAAEVKEVGAGLVLAPNAVRLLRRLGVMDKLLDRAVALEESRRARRMGRTVLPVRGARTRRQARLGGKRDVKRRSLPGGAGHVECPPKRFDTIGEADESRTAGRVSPASAVVTD